ncbi:NB-ARC - like 10 [Theobroma cacao]|nr:NB-ARC - like 10 [Theobroma cacao]
MDYLINSSVPRKDQIKSKKRIMGSLTLIRVKEKNNGCPLSFPWNFQSYKAPQMQPDYCDDIWTSLKLDEVGIAFGDHEHRGCKVLITSKDPDVLHGMHANRHFRVDALKEAEAWNLFKKTAGDIVEDPHVQSKAIDACRRCAGLPIAIVPTAKALKNRTPPEWENALKQLKSPLQTMPADPRSAIELSFNHLANEDLKSAFLLCMRSCHRLKNLFSFSVARGLLQLQEIEMVDCKDMVEIIAEGGESDIGKNGATTKIEFRQLQLLTLKQVPKLISFNTSSTTMALFNQKISGTRDYDHLEKQAASYSIRDE